MLHSNDQRLNDVAVKLTQEGIMFSRNMLSNVIILDPVNKPEDMTWPTWQFNLKYVSYYNQGGLCICGQQLSNIRELHHAILSRRDVMGCKPEVRGLIHHSFNTFEICKDCHQSITRALSIRYLSDIYGEQSIINWYNDFPMKTKIFKIEQFFS